MSSEKLAASWFIGAFLLLVCNIPSCTARVGRLPSGLSQQSRTGAIGNIWVEYSVRAAFWPVIVGWTGLHAVAGDIDWGWESTYTPKTTKGDGDACR